MTHCQHLALGPSALNGTAYLNRKVRADGAPFDTFYIPELLVNRMTAVTTVDKPKGL
ncbi:hypothetical protein B0H17DRAFT_1102365 [Mycena rosella]|uniref:Uncharacterized protein n=1 Tax=Mycena rosella TaxID=1033263 RepID=A0AAD7G181_MYCRO|nr:hypothetical protein B0H17DRAFT_1102365 [Mycena rosella]